MTKFSLSVSLIRQPTSEDIKQHRKDWRKWQRLEEGAGKRCSESATEVQSDLSSVRHIVHHSSANRGCSMVFKLTDIVTSGGDGVQGSFNLDQRTVIIGLFVSKGGA